MIQLINAVPIFAWVLWWWKRVVLRAKGRDHSVCIYCIHCVFFKEIAQQWLHDPSHLTSAAMLWQSSYFIWSSLCLLILDQSHVSSGIMCKPGKSVLWFRYSWLLITSDVVTLVVLIEWMCVSCRFKSLTHKDQMWTLPNWTIQP